MEQLAMLLLFAFSLINSCASCDKDAAVPGAGNNPNNDTNPTGGNMRIKVGNSTFAATLYNNGTAAAFKAVLPITVEMIELNSNEKYFDLSASLPANASNPGIIQVGDLMLYGSKTLVLFYKTFSRYYTYTRVGRIDDVTGLAAALGSGNITVAFELEK
jgi:hypothetical protein